MNPSTVGVCEECFTEYPVDRNQEPKTDLPYTCDDGRCLGYVALVEKSGVRQFIDEIQKEVVS